MTEIERKALELVNDVRDERGYHPLLESFTRKSAEIEALCRAIEQHEAFRQEVSDAVESLCNTVLMSHGHRQLREMLSHRFILPKPNPLVEAVKDILDDDSMHNAEEFSEAIRAALAKRGLEIREKSDG